MRTQNPRTRWILIATGCALVSTTSWAQHPAAQGGYTLEIVPVNDAQGPDVRVRVHRAGAVIATIEPNPGGGASPSSFAVRFTAGNNVLMGWSCGSDCSVNRLFTPTGQQLATYDDAPHVSPSGDLAVTVHVPFAARQNTEVQVVDLRTGRAVHTQRSPDAWNACQVQWSPTHVRLQPCDARTQPVSVTLPRR